MTGQLNLIIGPMFSGKTTELIRRYRRHKVAGRNCIFIKFDGDTRYEIEKVVTHDKITVDAVKTDLLSKVDKQTKSFDVICIDEVQFYSDAPFFCDYWANEGKIVEVCGLNSTFDRRPFKSVSDLIAKADSIVHLTAICEKTKHDAPFSKRLIDNKEEKLIGGKDMYCAVDRVTYFGETVNKKEKLEKNLSRLIEYFLLEGVLCEEDFSELMLTLELQLDNLDFELSLIENFKILEDFIKKN